MVFDSWEAWLAQFDAPEQELADRFRALAANLPETVESIARTEVRFKRQRTYAALFIRSHRLEVAIDLLREVHHPLLRAAFPTTLRVITHRLYFEHPDQIDDVVADLVREAYETVGPGTR